jgi:hypothetical protein
MDTSKLINRLTGALMFRQGVYDEVEADESFTPMAWILVIVTAVLSSIGSTRNIVGIIVSAIFAIVGFFVGALVIGWVGRTVFKATVTTQELIRTQGLAYVWRVLGFFGFITCIGWIIGFAAAILGLIASFIAAKAALDLDWVQTIVTVVIGWLVLMVITIFASVVLGIIGVGVSAGLGALGR